MNRPILGLVLALVATAAQAQGPAQRLVFVGCPMLRNTPPVPCWLGRAGGQLYYLGPQGDLGAAFYPPQFNHQMLVEATLSDAPSQCGAIVLKDVHASVLPDLDPTCNVILPAEGLSESDKIRGPGPSGARGESPEVARRPPAPAPFSSPFTVKTFVAPFDADTDRLWREAQTAVNEAARYAKAAKASAIEVTGYRAAIRLSDGKTFVEHAGLSEARAKAVAENLRTLDLPTATTLKVVWIDKPAPATGTARDAEARRVVISVKP